MCRDGKKSVFYKTHGALFNLWDEVVSLAWFCLRSAFALLPSDAVLPRAANGFIYHVVVLVPRLLMVHVRRDALRWTRKCTSWGWCKSLAP
jgi:hypothetical protein